MHGREAVPDTGAWHTFLRRYGHTCTAILTAKIVKITCGHEVLWRHPSYNNRLTFMVTSDGAYDILDDKNAVLFHSDDQNKAARMFKFMKGDSNRF